MTDQKEDFFKVLHDHLQPIFNKFMNLELWARICISDIDGNDELICEFFTEKFPGFYVDGVTVDCTDISDPWTPKCRVVLGLEIKDYDVRVDVFLTHATITNITFGNHSIPKELEKIDLVKEFQRKHLLLSLSQ